MIWSLAEIILSLSVFLELRPGDLIFNGTPAGLCPLKKGYKLEGEL